LTKYLSVVCRDGFGSQYLKKMYGYGFCHLFPEYQYIYTEMNRINHRQHGFRHDDLQQMNDFVGWSNFPNQKVERKKIVVFDKMYKAFEIPDKIFSNEVVAEIRRRYFSSDKPAVQDGSIVVHIRRGDVASRGYGESGRKRHLTNEWYLSYIKKIISLYNNEKIIIHTNDNESIIDFFDKNLDCNRFNLLHFRIKNHIIREDHVKELQYTFHEMVAAKVLFIGKSSLSHVAGILNPNKVYYINHGKTDKQIEVPLSRWKFLK
tara:strand:- start:28 stop:813 length:786 start_codon:yes stop_codon:yes gene_type:complete